MLLVFDGIKMGGSITLNGVSLGMAVDQYLRYEYPITASGAKLLPGDNANSVSVSFDSSTLVQGRFMACTGESHGCEVNH